MWVISIWVVFVLIVCVCIFVYISRAYHEAFEDLQDEESPDEENYSFTETGIDRRGIPGWETSVNGRKSIGTEANGEA